MIDGSFVFDGAVWLRPTALDATSNTASAPQAATAAAAASLGVRFRMTPPPLALTERPVFTRDPNAASPEVDERGERARPSRTRRLRADGVVPAHDQRVE